MERTVLNRIKIERFKSIELFDEALEPVNLLIGSNSSGKTSVMNAIHTSVSIVQSRSMMPGFETMSEETEKFSLSPTDILYLPSVDIGWLAPNGLLTDTFGPTTRFTLEEGTPKQEGTVSIFRGENRNLTIAASGKDVIGKLAAIETPFSIYVPGLAGIARSESFMAKGSLLRAVARGDANLVLRNVLFHLRGAESKWVRFAHELQRVYTETIIEVSFDPEIDEFINVVVSGDGKKTPLDCAGTGFLQVVQILSYIYLFEPSVLLLDEPDAHLHPNNQRVLANLLWELSSNSGTKIIIATHSRHILDAMRHLEKVKVIWLRNGRVVPIKAHLEVLTSLGALDQAEGLLAHNIEFVLLTEDEDQAPIKVLFEANGAVPGRFQVWSYKGCCKLDVADAVGRFVKYASPMTKVIVHRDSDFMDDKDKDFLRQQFTDYGLDMFLPPCPDPEGVLSRIDHLKLLNPGYEAEVQAAFNNALATSGDKLKHAALKGRAFIDNLRHKYEQPTDGEHARRDWVGALDLQDERWRHGKLFLSAIRDAYQRVTSRRLKSDLPTPALEIPDLKSWIATATHRAEMQPMALPISASPIPHAAAEKTGVAATV